MNSLEEHIVLTKIFLFFSVLTWGTDGHGVVDNLASF